MYEHATAITKAVGMKEVPLAVDYRLREIFEVLLDPAQEALVFQYDSLSRCGGDGLNSRNLRAQ